ncbi:helix-turn-helix domain-containing protein [Frigidibacter sp. MR17.24]|uniref:helix-turn-helix domain-containing protein n=1 Tax=Frigidibacter sp. MR17.24 TaxID=3127345 RepID=UPI003012D07F
MPALHPLLTPAQAPLAVTILVLPGTRSLAFAGLVDPLSRHDAFALRPVSATGRAVTLADGSELGGLGALREAGGDCLIVLAPPGAEARESARAIARASARFAIVGAVGGGLALLAQAGLLEGRTIACPLDDDGLPAPFAIPARLRFADGAVRLDGDRLSAASPGAAAQLALALIEARIGAEAAAETARALGLGPAAPAPEAEPPETEAPRPEAADPRVAAAIARMRASIADPPSAAEIARDLNLSPRRLEGLFRAEFGTGPGGFALNLRLEAARELLTDTRMAVADIARATGFSSAGTLARAFRGRYDQSPSDLRRRAISQTTHGLARRS